MQLYSHQSYDKILNLRGKKKKIKIKTRSSFNQKDTVTHHLLPLILSFIQSWSFKINESYSFFIRDAIFQIELDQMQYLWR